MDLTAIDSSSFSSHVYIHSTSIMSDTASDSTPASTTATAAPPTTTKMTAAERAAARRAKILARGKERMATVTSGMSASQLPCASASPDTTMEDQRVEAENRAKLLEQTLAEMEVKPAHAPARASMSTATAHDATSSTDSPPLTPLNAATLPDASTSLLSAVGDAISTASSSSMRRRAAKSSSTADSSLVDPGALPPPPSSLQQWQRRVRTQWESTNRSRVLITFVTVTLALLGGVGWIDGAMGWLLCIQLLAFGIEIAWDRTKQQHQPSVSRTQSTSTPPPPAQNLTTHTHPAVTTDDDVIELDTAQYRAQQQQQASNPFAMPDLQSMMSKMGGEAGHGHGPSQLDTMLNVLKLLMQYGSLMRRLLNETSLFLFITVSTNAIWQMTLNEKIAYVGN